MSEAELAKWSLYDLSWLGRLYAVKIMILPNVLYLFHFLPIALNWSDLLHFQACLSLFVVSGDIDFQKESYTFPVA